MSSQFEFRCGMAKVTGLRENTLEELLVNANVPGITWDVESFSIDEYNYVRNCLGNFFPEIDDEIGLNIGLDLSEILLESEKVRMRPILKDTIQKNTMINDWSNLFAKPDKSGIEMRPYLNGSKVVSNLEKNEHGYVRMKKPLDIVDPGLKDDIFIDFDVRDVRGLDVSLAFVCLDEKRNKITSIFAKPGKLSEFRLPKGTKFVWPWLRVAGPGEAIVYKAEISNYVEKINGWLSSNRVLLITNIYPSYDNLYQNAFVHRRVVEYSRSGLDADVFCFNLKRDEGFTEFGGVPYFIGYKHRLNEIIKHGHYDTILVHFLTQELWGVLEKYIGEKKMIVWVHGAEIQPWFRRDFNYNNAEEKDKAIKVSEKRCEFWRSILTDIHPNLNLVFISQFFFEEVTKYLEISIPTGRYYIIHNFIDMDLFKYNPKPVDMRKKILSIRPFASRTYANDQTVNAIVELSKRDYFNELEFLIMGDGQLFEETVVPISNYKNVTIEKRFATQEEISRIHKQYGVFLVPTRMDSQGVSRDEAMASGLVIITNSVAAIPSSSTKRQESSWMLRIGWESPTQLNGSIMIHRCLQQFHPMHRKRSKP